MNSRYSSQAPQTPQAPSSPAPAPTAPLPSLAPIAPEISQLATVDNPATLVRSIALLHERGFSTRDLGAARRCSLNKIHQLLRIARGLNATSMLLLQDGRITLGHARALAAFAHDEQDAIARQCLGEGWSVREIEHRRQHTQTERGVASERARPYTQLVAKISQQWGQPCDVVTSRANPERGRLSLTFSNWNELDSILRRLRVALDEAPTATSD